MNLFIYVTLFATCCSVETHQLRKHLVLKEMLVSIFVNFTFNLMLLVPLVILGINVFERHTILVNSIGAFPEEIEAFERIQLMLILSFTFLVLFTIIQMVSYYIYNGKFHPFALILQEDVIFEHMKASRENDRDSSTEC